MMGHGRRRQAPLSQWSSEWLNRTQNGSSVKLLQIFDAGEGGDTSI